MDSIREQMDLTNEISDAISNPVGMGNAIDEVRLAPNIACGRLLIFRMSSMPSWRRWSRKNWMIDWQVQIGFRFIHLLLPLASPTVLHVRYGLLQWCRADFQVQQLALMKMMKRLNSVNFKQNSPCRQRSIGLCYRSFLFPAIVGVVALSRSSTHTSLHVTSLPRSYAATFSICTIPTEINSGYDQCDFYLNLPIASLLNCGTCRLT